MKLTVENLAQLKSGDKFGLFFNGELMDIHNRTDIKDGIKCVYFMPYTRTIKEYVEKYNQFGSCDIFLLSDIRMPCTKTAEIADKLSEIEPTDRRCIAWFNSVEDEKLRAALLAEMDGDLATSRNAINLLDAMEQGLFIDEETENGKYLKRVIYNLKALQA